MIERGAFLNAVYLYSMKTPSCPGLDEGLHWSDILHRERKCWTCSHAIVKVHGHPTVHWVSYVAGCDRGLPNTSYPCDGYEREPGVD